jgi:hypothetical protein
MPVLETCAVIGVIAVTIIVIAAIIPARPETKPSEMPVVIETPFVIETPIVIEVAARVGILRTRKAAPGGLPAHTGATESTAADAPNVVTTTEAAAHMSASAATTEAATHMSASAATAHMSASASASAATATAALGSQGARPHRCTKYDGDGEDHDLAGDGSFLHAGR